MNDEQIKAELHAIQTAIDQCEIRIDISITRLEPFLDKKQKKQVNEWVDIYRLANREFIKLIQSEVGL